MTSCALTSQATVTAARTQNLAMLEVQQGVVWHPVRVSTGGAPSGVVTFLFTDIEGSTRRWETDADAMRAALAAHDEVLGRAIEAHDGFLVQPYGRRRGCRVRLTEVGGGRGCRGTTCAAVAGTDGLGDGGGRAPRRRLFRCGSEPSPRVMAAGHGGQILLADSTANQLTGVDLLDLGLRRLRDVSIAVRVFQIRAPGLGTEFPPIKVLDATPGNLRPGVTSFIGRELDIVELKAAVRENRLVTLTGPGGVGKTRLAIEVATLLTNEFPDGVWLFELAALSDPAAVPDAVAAVLNTTQQPGKSMQESVAAALEDRIRLLVLDNCEHVREAAADLIETILSRTATVKIVATSREGLGIANEQLWPVSPLDVGDGIDSAAVSLFVERARNVLPQFTLTESDAVIDVCRHLDGLPLAIELAASRMASMTAEEVRDRLDHRFQLLVGSPPRRFTSPKSAQRGALVL